MVLNRRWSSAIAPFSHYHVLFKCEYQSTDMIFVFHKTYYYGPPKTYYEDHNENPKTRVIRTIAKLNETTIVNKVQLDSSLTHYDNRFDDRGDCKIDK